MDETLKIIISLLAILASLLIIIKLIYEITKVKLEILKANPNSELKVDKNKNRVWIYILIIFVLFAVIIFLSIKVSILNNDKNIIEISNDTTNINKVDTVGADELPFTNIKKK